MRGSIASADYKTKLTLNIAGSEPTNDEAYVLTVPAEFTISKVGWNAFDGGIKAEAKSGSTFSGTLNITASSDNNWSLVLSPDKTDSIGYTLASQDEGAQNITWTFTADEVNASGGTIKTAGVIVVDYSSKTAGMYEDTITFTASTATERTITWASTFVSSINGDINNSKDGITLTHSSGNGFSQKYFNENSAYTYTSTVGSIKKIEIYTEGDVSDDDQKIAQTWGTDWSYDSTTYVFTWAGTPSASITTGLLSDSTWTTSDVTSFVFTVLE